LRKLRNKFDSSDSVGRQVIAKLILQRTSELAQDQLPNDIRQFVCYLHVLEIINNKGNNDDSTKFGN
jgi:hypothetical protein